MDGGTGLVRDGWLVPPPVMQLLAAHVPLLLLIDIAGATSVPAPPASPYDWGPGRGQLWVSPWALDPI